MSDDTTPRLALPFLQAGQGQKELTHNESLALLDIAVQPIVEAVGISVPPSAPLPGQCWIVGVAPSGAWTGRGGALAGWTAGGWRFLAAADGMSAWSINDLCVARHVAGQWEIGTVRARRLLMDGVQALDVPQAAIAAPSGGTVSDLSARQTIGEIIAVLQHHGLILSPA
jgi:hypothetical protein